MRVDYDEALELLDHEQDEGIVKAGLALSVLDEDPGTEEVLYVHQLVQEYFAGRQLAKTLDPARVKALWKTQGRRSWRVCQWRSMRPLASGLRAAM